MDTASTDARASRTLPPRPIGRAGPRADVPLPARQGALMRGGQSLPCREGIGGEGGRSMLRIDKPQWLDGVQHPPAAVPPGSTRPAPLLFDAEHRPITTVAAWVRRRTELRRAWLAFLGVIPGPRPGNRLEVVDEDHPEGVIRQRVRYEAERGLPVEGYLLRPDRPGTRRPAAVVLHSTVEWTIRQPAGLQGPADLHIGL